MAEPTPVNVGEPAPDLELPSSTGETVRLSDFRGKSEVVLFFYPKDNTPGCTVEACTFRDNYEAFREAGAEVIGISSDSTDSHRGFADRFRLPFVLLSDEKGTLRSRYGVPRTLGFFPGRVDIPDRPRGDRPPHLLVAAPAEAARRRRRCVCWSGFGVE